MTTDDQLIEAAHALGARLHELTLANLSTRTRGHVKAGCNRAIAALRQTVAYADGARGRAEARGEQARLLRDALYCLEKIPTPAPGGQVAST